MGTREPPLTDEIVVPQGPSGSIAKQILELPSRRVHLTPSKNSPAILFTRDVEGQASKLSDSAYSVTLLRDSADVLSHLESKEYGLVVISSTHPLVGNHALLKHINDKQHLTEVIVVSDHADVSTAVGLMKAGAFDVLVEPIESHRLEQSAGDALAQFISKKSKRREEEKNKALTSFE